MDQAERDAILNGDSWAYFVAGRDRYVVSGKPNGHREVFVRWRAMWDAHDFSWGGLADAGWERGDQANDAQKRKRWEAPADFPLVVGHEGLSAQSFQRATLQDYWRWIPADGWSVDQGWAGGRVASDEELQDLGLLVEVEGCLWHALHCPHIWAAVASDMAGGGSVGQINVHGALRRVGPDATSGALAAAILQRLALAGAHAPARLTGARAAGLDAVWRSFAGPFETRRPLYINASVAAFDSFDVSDLIFGDDAAFSHAAFGSGTSFRQAMFGDRAVFDRATFADKVSFRGAEFGDEAAFAFASFGDKTDFNSASFGRAARFLAARFGHEADFGRATFGDMAEFFSANLCEKGNFDSATFGDKADFSCTFIGDGVQFGSASFGDGTDFSLAHFGCAAIFSAAEFGHEASFFSVDFGQNADFRSANIGDRACFNRVYFSAGADFTSATFGEEAEFIFADFGDGAGLANATVGGGADFGEWFEPHDMTRSRR